MQGLLFNASLNSELQTDHINIFFE